MQELLFSTSILAATARQRLDKAYEVLDCPDCAPFLPAKGGVGEGRRFTPNQALLFLIHSDLNRWGLSVPFAGRVTCRIGETLCCSNAEADTLVITFHENGASFFTVANRGDLADTPADNGAGRARFRLVIDIAAYRDAVTDALERMGGELVEAA